MKLNIRWVKTSRRYPLPFLLLFIKLVLLALVVFIISESESVGWKILMGEYAVGLIISILFRYGWTTPCLIIGIFSGYIADAHPKSGSFESQMQETVGTLLFFTFSGLVFGLAVDLSEWTPAGKKTDEDKKALKGTNSDIE